MTEAASDRYVLGHSGRELDRLRRQAEVYADFTVEVFRRAGLAPGMSVLDVGCGVGDVSMAAAGIVGPAGAVLGIDRAEGALQVAAARADAAGAGHVRFERADIDEPDDRRFDAVVGRFILLHRPDPAATLASLASRLRPGGIVAFIEMDLSTADVVPPMPLFDQAMDWIRAVYARDGFHVDMGSRLFGDFRIAGLAAGMIATLRVEGGPDAYAYDYVAETVRSMLPRIQALGIADPAAIDVDGLADRLRRASVEGGHCFFYPRMIGAFARTAV